MDATARRSAFLSRAAAYAWLAAVLTVTATGRAEDDSDVADTAATRRLAVDGFKLAESGHCSEAIDKLARAEKLRHSAIVLEQLGECQVEVGRVVEGSESLRRVMREEVPANPSPALSKALNRAQAALASAKGKIAWLTVSVAPAVAEAQVSLDGKPVSAALLGDERPADPGQHLIEASAQGFFNASVSVTLGEGEKRAVSLNLELDPGAQAPRGAKARPDPGRSTAGTFPETVGQTTPATSGKVTKGAPNRTAAYVAWLVSGVAAGTGATFGVLAWRGKSDLDKECTGQACPPHSLHKLDRSRLYGNVATGAFSVAGAGLVLGTVLFATASPSSVRASTGSGPSRVAEQGGFRLHGFIGLEQVGVRGDF